MNVLAMLFKPLSPYQNP
ncbi:maker737 [Drosophila busckii]|uniref:Maker668 n=1 Tax=Drosophila busckii TaxID=30019 RepID=A0A0M3QWQ9_DROBS|nr:maker668 [Drosophila busckii]ALC44579.1 maker737 [Drosophila busckii]